MNLQSYSIRIIIFISFILFFIIPINDAVQVIPAYNIETDLYILVTIPFIVNAINFLGALYIFYRK